jgi:hypothetical protein
MKNFHLPLAEQTYSHLRAEAERAQVLVTVLAREAIRPVAAATVAPGAA